MAMLNISDGMADHLPSHRPDGSYVYENVNRSIVTGYVSQNRSCYPLVSLSLSSTTLSRRRKSTLTWHDLQSLQQH